MPSVNVVATDVVTCPFPTILDCDEVSLLRGAATPVPARSDKTSMSKIIMDVSLASTIIARKEMKRRIQGNRQMNSTDPGGSQHTYLREG